MVWVVAAVVIVVVGVGGPLLVLRARAKQEGEWRGWRPDWRPGYGDDEGPDQAKPV